jgi:hypothetical protein
MAYTNQALVKYLNKLHYNKKLDEFKLNKLQFWENAETQFTLRDEEPPDWEQQSSKQRKPRHPDSSDFSVLDSSDSSN